MEKDFNIIFLTLRVTDFFSPVITGVIFYCYYFRCFFLLCDPISKLKSL